MKRGLTHAEAIEYVGVKRRTFDEMWRPKLNPMRQGSCLIFDRLDLDRVFDEFKAAAAPAAANDDGAEPLRHNGPRNGRPSQETGERRWAKKQGVSTPGENGTWEVDKWRRKDRFRQRGFGSFEERWLITQLAARREVVVHGAREVRTFEAAAAHYVTVFQDKTSIATEIYLLDSVMPFIEALELHQVHDATLAPYVSARLEAGRSHKTNLALGVVRRILNLAATKWRDESGRTWLQQAPKITMLPLVGHQREPQPITWAAQRGLLPKLPDHLARMSLFILNTGVRNDVACSLEWAWEIKVPELGISVFEVPREHVKGKKRSRVVVCNSVAQSVVDAVRGQYEKYVFVYRRERVKNTDLPPKMAFRRIGTMNNTAWQRAREEAGLSDLHVHDLRHTVGMRLREAGVSAETISDLLWHSTGSMTLHYSVAQIVELHGALELIKADSGRWNKSLATLRREQQEGQQDVSPPKVPAQKKTA